MTGALLIISYRDGSEQQLRLAGPVARIGRAADNDVLVDDQLVSSAHCELTIGEQGWFIRDLGSTNGTLLDGRRLAAYALAPLTPRSLIQIGDARLRLAPAPAEGAGDELLTSLLGNLPSALPPQPSRLRNGPLIGLSVVPARHSVVPGEATTATVIVVNHATTSDEIELFVDGLPPAWIALVPPRHVLPPGGQGVSQLTITPPLEPESYAGQYAFSVLAEATLVDEAARTPVRLDVQPYNEFSVALDPAEQAGWIQGIYALQVVNKGNQAAVFLAQGYDDAAAFDFRFTPSELQLGPGESDIVDVEARLRPARIVGTPRDYPFTISVEPDDASAAPRLIGGLLRQSTPFPLWLIPAGLGVLVFAFALLLLLRFGAGIAATPRPFTPSLPPALLATPDTTASAAVLRATQSAAGTTQAERYTQTVLAGAAANQQTRTAIAAEVALLQSAEALQATGAVAAFETAIAATATSQAGALQAATAAAATALAQTAFAQSGAATVTAQTAAQFATLQAIQQTQTALAAPTAPAAILLVTFDTLNGVPVTGRRPINSGAYAAQGMSFCAFAVEPLAEGGEPSPETENQPGGPCTLAGLADSDAGLATFLVRNQVLEATAVILPPPADALESPTHVLSIERESEQPASGGLLLVDFMREVRQATVTVWLPAGETARYTLLAFDGTGQLTGRAELGPLSGPNSVQISVEAAGGPIKQLVILPSAENAGAPLYLARVEGAF